MRPFGRPQARVYLVFQGSAATRAASETFNRGTVSRSYLIFVIVSSALMMASIDATIVTVAIPTMLREMRTTLPLVTWSLTSYQLTQTIVLPLSGRLADKWGRKRIFLAAVVLFSLGSLGAGLSPSIYVLILFRVLQGAGGGMFFPSAAGVVGEVFPEGRRQTVIGLFVTIFQVGGVIGPNIGGLVIDNLSWRWIFFVNLPVGLAILLLAVPLVPGDRTGAERVARGIDSMGAALFAAAMFSLLFGLTYLANHPDQPASAIPWTFLGCGVFLLLAFIQQERRAAEPIIDLAVFRWRPFLAANSQLFMWSAAFNGYFNFVPYYATLAYGMSATESGAILTPRSLTAVVVSALSSVFVVRLGYRRPWLVGIYLLAASMLLMSIGIHNPHVLGLKVPDFVFLSAIVAVAGLGVGIAIPPSQNAVFDLLPDQMASVAGMRAMFGNSGAVIGTTAVTLVLSHFHDRVAGMRVIFFSLGLIVLVSQVLVFFVPDLKRRETDEAGARERTLAPAPVD
jgi:EmrB/QacA subfamily drug resistance transporter